MDNQLSTAPRDNAVKRLAFLFTELVRPLTTKPNEVTVEIIDTPEGPLLCLRVNDTDLDYVIGSNGRTARSLRIIMEAAARKLKCTCAVDFKRKNARQDPLCNSLSIGWMRHLAFASLRMGKDGPAMIECKELTGKVVRAFTIFEDGHYGPDIQIEFTDGTRFSACLKTDISIEAKYTRDEGGEPTVLTDYTSPAIPR